VPLRRSPFPAAAPAGCASGNLCFYANAHYLPTPSGHVTGTNYGYYQFSSIPPGGTQPQCIAGSTAAADDTNDSWNDCISSMYDYRDQTYWMYQNDNCSAGGGAHTEVGYEEFLPNMGNYAVGNDTISSDYAGADSNSCTGVGS
jgi:hypothetical protein